MTVAVNFDRKAVEVTWDKNGYEGDVRLVATGAEGDVHNTSAMKNDGRAVLTYPYDFSGSSHVQVLGDDDTVVDEGEITVG